MKITLGQINTTPNDFEGNFSQIKEGIEKALKDNSDIIVFPELTICGYLVKDLVYTSNFIENNLLYLQNVANLTFKTDLMVIVGYIGQNYTGIGKPFTNMAAVIKNGVVITSHQKRLLPAYNVFEEYLYFEPGKDSCVFDVKGNKCGLLTCEEIWRNDKGETDNLRYKEDPIKDLQEIGINYLFSINSSPYAENKPKYRIDMLTKIVSEWGHALNLIYVNQIGGNDDLVFDGHSMCITKGGVFKYLQTNMIPSKNMNIFETIIVPKNVMGAPYINFDFQNDHLRMILLGLHDYINKSGFKSVVLGSSGGIDSALVATLACKVVGPENVHCIMMPSIYSSEGSVTDAKKLHKNLGCNEYLVKIDHENNMHHINNSLIRCNQDIDRALANHNSKKEIYNTKFKFNISAEENLQARMRGNIVMHFSNAFGSLPLTTGNKTELAVGYCTLYGDMVGGFATISDLYKTQIFALSKYINLLDKKETIPLEIINKAPSAELAPGQTDEASLLPYSILDIIVKKCIEDYIDSFEEFNSFIQNNKDDYQQFLIEWLESIDAKKEYERIIRLININEFKRRQAAPGIKLSKVAFGTGRRLPICKKVTA